MAGLVAQWLRRLPAALSGRKLIGSDALGNQYYEVKHSGRLSRVVFSAEKEEDYDPGAVPAEWAAWLAKTRDTPPTPEEISAREVIRDRTLLRAADFERRDAAEAEAERLEAGTPQAPQESRTLGHASLKRRTQHTFVKPEPTSVDGDFTPGAWTPGSKS